MLNEVLFLLPAAPHTSLLVSGLLDLRVSPWTRVVVTRSIALVPSLSVALLYPNSNQLDALNQNVRMPFCGWARPRTDFPASHAVQLNLLQAVSLPFALVPLLTLTGSQSVMGGLVSSRSTTIAAGCIAAGCAGVNLAALGTVAREWLSLVFAQWGFGWGLAGTLACVLLSAVYVYFLLWLLWAGRAPPVQVQPKGLQPAEE